MGLLDSLFGSKSLDVYNLDALPHVHMERNAAERRIFDGYATALLSGILAGRPTLRMEPHFVRILEACVGFNATFCMQIRKTYGWDATGICPCDTYTFAALQGLASRNDVNLSPSCSLEWLKQAFEIGNKFADMRSGIYDGPDITPLL